MNKGIILLVVCLLVLISTNYKFVKDNCKILLLGIVLMVTYLYNHSDIMEGAENEVHDTGYKSFYAYFGREEDTTDPDKKKIIEINEPTEPPFYILNNRDFADLKGELSFIRGEWLNDSENFNRKYGINYIDKWLIRYHNKNDLGAEISFQNHQWGPNLASPALNGAITDINGGKYLGSSDSPPPYGPGSVHIGGNYFSILGECPNKTLVDKCINNKNECYSDIQNQSTECNPTLSRKVKLVDITNVNSKHPKYMPDDTHPIVAIYIGTLRLDDIVNRNNNDSGVNIEDPDSCTNNFKKVYQTVLDTPHPTEKYNNDKSAPIWGDLLKTKKKWNDYKAYKLLKNNNLFKCRLQPDKKYKTIKENIEISDTIYEISKNNFVDPSDSGGGGGGDNAPSTGPCINDEDKCECQEGYWCCTAGISIRGCQQSDQPWTTGTCKSQCQMPTVDVDTTSYTTSDT